jgi:tetratricopeptide (TPR) repeat protein
MILMQSGRVQEAEERCREALALQKKILGPEHATTQQTEGLLRLLLDMQKKSTEAEKISTVSSEAKNPEQEEIAAANKKAELAVAAMSRQKFAEAEAALRAALPVFEKAFGRKRQDVIGVRILLARTLLQNDKPTEAAQVTGELLADCRSVFGNQSSYLSNILILQALALQYDGKLSEAESALQEEITNAKGQTTDGKNVNVAMGLLLLASIKAEQGKLDDRDRMIGEAISMIQTAPKNIILGSCQMIETTAKYLMKRGRYGDAEAVEQVVVSSVRQLIGRDSDELAWVLTTYSWMESDAGKLVEAEASAREAWAIRQKILPPGHWLIATAEYSVAEWLYKQKKIDESEASFLDTFANLQIHGPENSDPRYNFWRERLMYSADYLKQIYTDKGQPEKAAEWKAKSAMYKVADETKDAAEQK